MRPLDRKGLKLAPFFPRTDPQETYPLAAPHRRMRVLNEQVHSEFETVMKTDFFLRLGRFLFASQNDFFGVSNLEPDP